jgi:hypothetical protein
MHVASGVRDGLPTDGKSARAPQRRGRGHSVYADGAAQPLNWPITFV